MQSASHLRILNRLIMIYIFFLLTVAQQQLRGAKLNTCGETLRCGWCLGVHSEIMNDEWRWWYSTNQSVDWVKTESTMGRFGSESRKAVDLETCADLYDAWVKTFWLSSQLIVEYCWLIPSHHSHCWQLISSFMTLAAALGSVDILWCV